MSENEAIAPANVDALLVERLRDAERYQWLIRNAGYGISRHQHAELYLCDRIVPAPDHISQISAAIDAAIQEKTP